MSSSNLDGIKKYIGFSWNDDDEPHVIGKTIASTKAGASADFYFRHDFNHGFVIDEDAARRIIEELSHALQEES